MPTNADAIALLLADAGIEYIFGMPGSRASVELIESARRNGIRYVLSNNESAAAVMAATYGILRRRPGVCSTGVGPGATNAVNGVAHAMLERAPMLLFTDRYSDQLYRHLPRQRVDQEQLFRPVTKGSFPIADDSAERSVRRAMQLAMEGRPGPVHLDLPDDVVTHAAPDPAERLPYQRLEAVWDTQGAASHQFVAALGKALRPVVVAGLGVNREGCEPQLQMLAETLGAPVLLTVSAKGSIPSDHRLYGGTLLGSEASHPLLAKSDTILTVGLDTVELFDPGQWPYPQTLLSIDATSHAEGLLRPADEFVGSIRSALEALAATVGRATGWSSQYLADLERPSLDGRSESRSGLAPAAALRELRAALPRNAILSADAGQHKVVATRVWDCYEPLTYLTSSGLGSMGVAIPIAIAAKLARPAPPVVALTGDGGFLMRVSELETAKREGVPIVVVVFNDGYLNLIKIKQEKQGYPPVGSRFAPVDYTRVAEGFGFRAARADSEPSLRGALRQAMASGEPWVIDAVIDPDGYL